MSQANNGTSGDDLAQVGRMELTIAFSWRVLSRVSLRLSRISVFSNNHQFFSIYLYGMIREEPFPRQTSKHEALYSVKQAHGI